MAVITTTATTGIMTKIRFSPPPVCSSGSCLAPVFTTLSWLLAPGWYEELWLAAVIAISQIFDYQNWNDPTWKHCTQHLSFEWSHITVLEPPCTAQWIVPRESSAKYSFYLNGHRLGFFAELNVRTTLYGIVKSTTWKYCSIAFIWMVTH